MNTALPHPIDLQEAHQPVWVRIEPILLKQHLPPAFLFSGARHLQIISFAHQVMAYVLCKGAKKPCGNCQSCHFIKYDLHPDIIYLGFKEETLKIDEIRQLQRDVYQTPQHGAHRFVVILAQKLHISVSNALLKILEEPANHTCFILLSEAPQTLPLTILSRCQHYAFCEIDNHTDYLNLATYYPPGSKRYELCAKQDILIKQLCDLMENKASVCSLAQEWAKFEFEDVLWFLYLMTAQAIRTSFIPKANHALAHFVSLINPMQLLVQLHQLTIHMKQHHQNLPMNVTLALEALFLGYTKEGCHDNHC